MSRRGRDRQRSNHSESFEEIVHRCLQIAGVIAGTGVAIDGTDPAVNPWRGTEMS
jgi:hypothetical protein